MRMGPGRTGARPSDNISLPPTSPGNISLPATSPARGLGANMSEIDLSSPLNYGTPSSMGSIRTPRSGIRGTPLRARPDIRTDKRIRQVAIGGSSGVSTTRKPFGQLKLIGPLFKLEPIPEKGSETTDPVSESSQAPQLVVWGTNVVVSQCKSKFKSFIMRFIDPSAEQDEISENIDVNQPLYLQKLEEIHTLEEPYLNLNCSHLKTFDQDLYRQLICYPQEVIPGFDMAINEMFFERYPAALLEHQIQVRPFNADKTRNMRSLNPEDMDQLISISGMVIRSSNVIPEMREAFFSCNICSFCTTVEVDRGRINQPTLCTNCNTNHCFRLIHNRSEFTDKQLIKLQESPDDMAAGQTPHNVLLYAHNDLVDKVQPGDRVTVTGIYRATPLKGSGTQVKSVYKTHVDVVHFRKVDNKRLYEEEEGLVFSLLKL